MAIAWKRDSQVEVVPLDVEAAPQTGPRIECNICLLPYSQQNVPRVLKECGHTICTGCATKLLAIYSNLFLFCPTCRMATVVKGPAIFLPRNHALLGMVEELKKKAKTT